MTYTHGTLYNSYPQMIAALKRTMEECGLPAPSPAEALPLFKHSVFYTISHYAALYGLETETLLAAYRRQHEAEAVFPPYEGLADCLARLHTAGCKHYLYTHRDRLAIELLEKDGVWRFFSGGVTSEDGFPHKPAPDALLSLLKQHRLEPSACIMIGDRGIDIESGLNAGIAGAVFDPEGQYFGPEAAITAHSMAELAEKLLNT